MLKPLTMDHNKLENFSRDGNTRPPYRSPEKHVCRSRNNRTGHETTDWFKIGKGVCQGCILLPCLFNLYTEWKWKSLGRVWLSGPWNSLGRNTGVGSLSLLQGSFPTQGMNPGLPHCRQILYQLSHKRSPRILEWVAYHFSSRSSRPKNRTGISCIAGGFFTNWVKST